MRYISIILLTIFFWQSCATAQVSIVIGTSNTLTVSGNMTITLSGNWYNNGTFTAGQGQVIFNGSGENQLITNSAGETFNNLTVNKAGGDVQLNDNLTVNGTLILSSGDVDLNGYAITLGSSATITETTGNTVRGTTGLITVTRSLNAPSNYNIAGLGVELTSSANLGSTVITRGHTAQTGNENNGIERYFDITPTNNSSLNATLVLHYDDSELNSLTESELIVFKSTDTGANWALMGGTVNTANNTVTLAGIEAFSRWTLGASSTPLPVELISFTASVRSSSVELLWQTSTEVNNYGFNVERRINQSNWDSIAFIEGHGNSNSPKDYSYTDQDLFAGGSRFQYRLKQVDNDGRFEYSEIVEVEVVPSQFELSQNYPNPFNPSTTIRFSLPKATQLKINLYNLLGELVETIAEGTYEKGYYKEILNASSLPSGTYFYRFESSDFIQTKKLLLLK